MLLTTCDHLKVAVVSMPGKRNVHAKILHNPSAFPFEILRDLRFRWRSRRF
jgi:hypothetical protein